MSSQETWLGLSPVLIYRAITGGAILTYIIDLILGKILSCLFKMNKKICKDFFLL